MVKIVLGVIAGFVAWSILWVGSDQVLMVSAPTWYGAHQLDLELARATQEPFSADSTILLFNLFRGVIVTIMSGFLAAFIANENRRTPLILGVLLLLVGIGVEAMYWNQIPIWYHLVFLGMLIPVTILGGKLKQVPAIP
jgi:hypothetical protein